MSGFCRFIYPQVNTEVVMSSTKAADVLRTALTER